MQNLQEIAEFISNGLALPTILMSFCVVLLWLKPACFSLGNRRPLDTQGWFIIGVFTGFIGESLDNLYWTLAWSAHYLELGSSQNLMNFGVFSNIPFRQGLGIFAAYCHVRSALCYGKHHENKKETVNKLLIIAIILGFLYSLSLAFAKHT